MTEWETKAERGIVVGIGLMATITMVDIGLIWLAAIRPLRIGTFIIGLAVGIGLFFVLTLYQKTPV